MTGEGRERFRKAAKAFARLGEHVDLLYSSPLVRAVQTAELLAEALELEEVAVLEELRPEVPVKTLLERAAKLEGKRVALVGHDPQMSGIAAALGGVEPSRVDFPKGAIVRIDADDPAARKAEPRWWLDAGEKKPREGLPLK